MGRIIVGDRVHFTSVFGPSLLTAYPDSVLEVGDRTVINHTADISATNLVRIGSDCMIGTNVIILDNDFHDLVDRGRTPTGKPVIIGNGAWIGNRVTILPGVTIGEEAAIGAGSVVMTDIPPRSLALGNPARVIKRF